MLHRVNQSSCLDVGTQDTLKPENILTQIFFVLLEMEKVLSYFQTTETF